MKKIILVLPVKTAQGFEFHFGNKRTSLFTNVLVANKFVTDTNVFFTDQLTHLNSLFATVVNEYREHWVYFDTSRTSGRPEKIKNNSDIIDRIVETFYLFETVLVQSGTNNGYYLIYRTFEKITKNILFITGILKNMDLEKSYYSMVQRLNLIERYTNEIAQTINNYPQIKNK
jgi:hypothetical protein